MTQCPYINFDLQNFSMMSISAESFKNIPSLDLNQFLSGNEKERAAFVENLGEAFVKVGFVAVKNHRLDNALIDNLYHVIKRFFSLHDTIKQKYEIPGLAGQRGYTGKAKEHAKGRNTGDLKEFFHVGQIVEDNDPIVKFYPENVWVEEVPELEEYAKDSYKKLEQTGRDLLKAVALYLQLPETFFEDMVHNGNSILRPIHYYPIEDPASVPDDAVRAAEHEDINLITLLMGASAEGLEILRKDGEWVSVTALPGQIVVNVGDMLSRLTNDILKSTTHRVVNPPKEKMNSSRFSIPFFLHPRPEMDLSCLTGCISEKNPKKYEDLTAGQYLDERLIELGLK